MNIGGHPYAPAAFLLGFLAGASEAEPLRIPVSDFAGTGIAGWEHQSFQGQTRYRISTANGRPVLHAHSVGAASGLVRRLEIDLARTPYLNWSWRIERPLAGLDEQSKAGDDYAARVYVVQSGGALFWRTRAVNYVWSGSQAAGTRWFNAYTDRACMIALRGPRDGVGEWQSERRNVQADFRRCFDLEVGRADAVALMTDTDNAGGEAMAQYGEIAFSSD